MPMTFKIFRVFSDFPRILRTDPSWFGFGSIAGYFYEPPALKAPVLQDVGIFCHAFAQFEGWFQRCTLDLVIYNCFGISRMMIPRH